MKVDLEVSCSSNVNGTEVSKEGKIRNPISAAEFGIEGRSQVCMSTVDILADIVILTKALASSLFLHLCLIYRMDSVSNTDSCLPYIIVITS